MMVDSQTSPTTEDSSFLTTPLVVSTTTTATQQAPPPPFLPLPVVAAASNQLLRASSKAITANENSETKQKPIFNNQTTQIVIAKYSYEPLQYSPNDHPEIELPLNIGEYYLTYGEVDEVSVFYLK